MSVNDRLKEARVAAGYSSSAEAARAMGVGASTYAGHENGSRGIKADAARLYARRFKVRVEWLLYGTGAMRDGDNVIELFDPEPPPPPNARISTEPLGEFPKVPVFGQAIGGDDGYFVLNGNRIDDILAPPILSGVREAYAVYVAGESMEPRYYAGEAVFVHPKMPVRRGDFVIAQIKIDGEVHGYVKRFIKMNNDVLCLEQFQPEKTLEFPRQQVLSVHKIVASGV